MSLLCLYYFIKSISKICFVWAQTDCSRMFLTEKYDYMFLLFSKMITYIITSVLLS